MTLTPEQSAALAKLRDIWPDKAAEIEAILAAETDDVRRASLKIEIGVRYKLEKFDGDYAPGMVPVEVIEGSDTMGEQR